MRYIILLLPVLTACVPQYTQQSPHDQIVQKCAEAGYKDKEFDDCVRIATDVYIAKFNRQTALENEERIKAEKESAREIERQDKEYAIEMARRKKEAIKDEKEAMKEQKLAKKRQLDADSEKCKDYGFRSGTDKFAVCMQQIENSREMAVLEDHRMEQEKEMQQQQIKAEQDQRRAQYYQEQEQLRRDAEVCNYSTRAYATQPGGDYNDCIQKLKYYRANPSAPPIYTPPVPQPVHTYQPPPTPIQNREIRCTTKKDYGAELLGRDVILTECN